MDKTIPRRDFLKAGAASAAAFQFLQFPLKGESAPSNKLNIAGIGLKNIGLHNLRNAQGANVIAVADVDTTKLYDRGQVFPEAHKYQDYREMFAAETDLDGVIIATPDHSHAQITMDALRRGLHVYTQKPLAHNIADTRYLTEQAGKSGLIHQMGHQGRSFESTQVLKEWLNDGVIGNVKEVHGWTTHPATPTMHKYVQEAGRPPETPPVPDELDWDLWLGPAPYRPYHPYYHPAFWRVFHDFGTGPLGDMGIHIFDPAWYALELGAPTAVEAITSHWNTEDVEIERFPRASQVRMEFAASKVNPAVTFHWYDGGFKPMRPKGLPNDAKLPRIGALIVGEEGFIIHGSHGASSPRIYPESLRKAYMPERPEPYLPRVKGNHETAWVRACQENYQPAGNFVVGGPITEIVLLGALSTQVPNQRLEWDAENMQITNHAGADALVRETPREGWKLGSV